MILKKVGFLNFRNIERAEISFSPGVNLLYGDNAQGKTNALEGVYLCAQGRSHRTAHERDYIRAGEDFAKVTLNYENRIREEELELRYLKNGRKYCRKNKLPLRKMSEFIGNFRAVIFCPEYLAIVREGPSDRRAFADSALSQLDPVYLSALQRYNAALVQRNRLITLYPFDPGPYESTQELWAQQLAEYGEIISQARAGYIEEISKEVKEIFKEMTSGRETPELVYKKPLVKEEYLRALNESRQRELKAGSTLLGVHKDDIEITLNGEPAKTFCSQGQQRSIAVAMKLAEGAISGKRTGEDPVYLLDDVLSELDDKRREFILSGLDHKQVLITCCDERDAEKIGKGSVVRVENGQYTKIR